MSIDRRVSAESRRRRVIYQTTRDQTTETAAERRAAEKLREARRPAANYGSHVNRRLRGRWFSLVPVRRRTMAACGATVLGSALVLAALHWAAVTWAPLSMNAELARPLRLDRPDSLGNWARTFFLAAAAGTALLVYQLRRYKVDDYKGHYRLWRPVIVLLGIMSVDSVCDLVPWVGAMIDGLLGRRMAFSGADWIRVVMTIGGGALALRLIAEVWRSKLALGLMMIALIGFAVPMSARWNLLDATTVPGWFAVTSAPLLAAAALWVSIASYLRLLFREVRGLDHESAANEPTAIEKPKAGKRVVDVDASEEPRGWFRKRTPVSEEGQGSKQASVPTKSPRSIPKAAPEHSDRSEDKDRTVVREPQAKSTDARVRVNDVSEIASPTKRSWRLPFFGKNAADSRSEQTARDESKRIVKDKAATSVDQKDLAVDKRESATEKSAPEPKRRWLGLRSGMTTPADKESKLKKELELKEAQPTKVAPKPVVAKTDSPAKPESNAKTGPTIKAEPAEKAAGSWFTWGRSKAKAEPSEPKATSAATSQASTTTATQSAVTTEKPERKGLGSWLRRDSAAKPPVPEKTAAAKQTSASSPADTSSGDDDDEGDIDDDSVDWSAMNKSERRRMRKEIKRGGRAA